MLTAPSKTFNIAGTHTGNVIIPDNALREKYNTRSLALALNSNSFGVAMTTAAYSAEGAAWVDELVPYLDRNRQTLETGLASIPGVAPMTCGATYLSWVDFSGTGMSSIEIRERLLGQAKVVPNMGASFGSGGETFMRFNFGTQHARIEEAVHRIQAAFSDLQ